MTDTRTDHERVASSGAWAGAALGMLLLMAADLYIPLWCAFALNWTVILGACGAIAVYKARWYGWLCFWGLAVTCLVTGVLKIAGAVDAQPISTAAMIAGGIIAFFYYWLVRMPRRQPEAPAQRREVHVFHHVIHHGQQAPGVTVTAGRGEIPAQKVIAGSVMRAIEAPRRKADGLLAAAREAISSRRAS